MLTSIVVYLYTVIAFSFFRKFYASEGEEGETDYKCHDMATVRLFSHYVLNIFDIILLKHIFTNIALDILFCFNGIFWRCEIFRFIHCQFLL